MPFLSPSHVNTLKAIQRTDPSTPTTGLLRAAGQFADWSTHWDWSQLTQLSTDVSRGANMLIKDVTEADSLDASTVCKIAEIQIQAQNDLH